jgi:hypothetical protein
MVHINPAASEIDVKIVYCSGSKGAGLTALNTLKKILPSAHTGNVVSLSTESGQTLFFDFLPVTLGKVGNYNVQLKLYTAPEASYYDASRKLVVDGADGIIFIVDAVQKRLEQNKKMLSSIKEYITGLSENIPIVFQWHYTGEENNEDPVLSPEELESQLNTENNPSFTIQEDAQIVEPLKETVKMVFVKGL